MAMVMGFPAWVFSVAGFPKWGVGHGFGFFFFLNVICELCGGHGYEFFGVGVLGYWFVGVGRGFGVFFLCDL